MEMTYQDLLNKLIKGENFSFARYGDGEFFAMLGGGGKQNTDGHLYYKAMGLRLLKIVMSKPEYIMGLQGKAYRERIDEAFKTLIQGIDWVNSDIIHHASIKGNLNGLFKALSHRKIMLVSKVDLAGIGLEIPIVTHIIINEKNCWLDYKEIYERIRANVSTDIVILYCAGMPTEVFIDDIYNEFKNVTQIDIGSAFDPYVGINIRSYHKDIIDKL